jgi:hypothetical protein
VRLSTRRQRHHEGTQERVHDGCRVLSLLSISADISGCSVFRSHSSSMLSFESGMFCVLSSVSVSKIDWQRADGVATRGTESASRHHGIGR